MKLKKQENGIHFGVEQIDLLCDMKSLDTAQKKVNGDGKNTRASKATKNYEKFLSEYADKMSIDDYYIEHLMATNEKLDFVRMNETGTIQYYVPPQSGKLLSDNWMDILLSGSYAGFDTEKSVYYSIEL